MELARQLRMLAAGATALAVGACSAPAEQTRAPVRMALRDGASLSALASRAAPDTSVVLVYNPADCFTCDGELAHWIQLRTQRKWGLKLVLTREPTASEATQLHLFRLKADGYLHHTAVRVATPRVYRYGGDVLIDSAVGRPGQSALLARAARGDAGPAFSAEGGPPRFQPSLPQLQTEDTQ